MKESVLFSLVISIACMIAIVDARDFEDYDSIGLSGWQFRTMSIGGNYAPYRSNFDLLDGDAPLQNVHVGGFGRMGRFPHRLLRPHGSGSGSGGGNGNGQRGHGSEGDRTAKSDQSPSDKRKEEPSTDLHSDIGSSESKLIPRRDILKQRAEEQAKFEEKFQKVHGMTIQELHEGKLTASSEMLDLNKVVADEWMRMQEIEWKARKAKAKKAKKTKEATDVKEEKEERHENGKPEEE